MRSDKKTFATIDEYIAAFPEAVQERLVRMRRIIRENAPSAAEKISWQIPTFYLKGNLVHFAAHKKHIGFYPGAEAMVLFDGELTAYERSKGAVRFPMVEPLPEELIARIVRFRVQENLRPKMK